MPHVEMSRWGVACAAPVGHDLLVAGIKVICMSPAACTRFITSSLIHF